MAAHHNYWAQSAANWKGAMHIYTYKVLHVPQELVEILNLISLQSFINKSYKCKGIDRIQSLIDWKHLFFTVDKPFTASSLVFEMKISRGIAAPYQFAVKAIRRHFIPSLEINQNIDVCKKSCFNQWCTVKTVSPVKTLDWKASIQWRILLIHMSSCPWPASQACTGFLLYTVLAIPLIWQQ